MNNRVQSIVRSVVRWANSLPFFLFVLVVIGFWTLIALTPVIGEWAWLAVGLFVMFYYVLMAWLYLFLLVHVVGIAVTWTNQVVRKKWLGQSFYFLLIFAYSHTAFLIQDRIAAFEHSRGIMNETFFSSTQLIQLIYVILFLILWLQSRSRWGKIGERL